MSLFELPYLAYFDLLAINKAFSDFFLLPTKKFMLYFVLLTVIITIISDACVESMINFTYVVVIIISYMHMQCQNRLTDQLAEIYAHK